jgi:hypothetical protein
MAPEFCHNIRGEYGALPPFICVAQISRSSPYIYVRYRDFEKSLLRHLHIVGFYRKIGLSAVWPASAAGHYILCSNRLQCG